MKCGPYKVVKDSGVLRVYDVMKFARLTPSLNGVKSVGRAHETELSK